MRVPFSRVVCDDSELQLVREVLESGWLTTASRAHELERRFGEAVGAPYACAVNSCTAALHLALESIGVGPGDRVFVPTWTFTATAEVVRYLGADPVFLDVDADTALLTPEIVEAALADHPEAKAVIAVHFAGQPVRMTGKKGLLELCRERGLRVVEDAAHAFPTRIDGRMVGSLGDATCFSFYANKTITTGEGGMVTTGDERLFRRWKVMRLHGIDRDIWDRFTGPRSAWEYDVVAPGFKYNLPDVNAAIGLAQLRKANALRDERQRCAEYYLRHLSDVQGIVLPRSVVPHEDHAWHIFPITIADEAGITRNDFIERLADVGVGTSVHYKPIHRMTYYRERYSLQPEAFPNAERLWRGCVSLPIFASLCTPELEHVVSSIRGALKH